MMRTKTPTEERNVPIGSFTVRQSASKQLDELRVRLGMANRSGVISLAIMTLAEVLTAGINAVREARAAGTQQQQAEGDGITPVE